MRKLGWTAIVVGLALGATPAPAFSQTTSGFAFEFGSTKAILMTGMPATVTGDLEVSFHGDPGTGCATFGVCGYTGVVIFRPNRYGALLINEFLRDGHLEYDTSLGVGFGDLSPVTVARVERSDAGSGRCVDGEAQDGADFGTAIRGGRMTVSLLAPGGSLLQTRCAAPLDGDLAGISPRVVLPLARLLRGHQRLDLSGTRSFAEKGFAGTISSTIVVTLGAPYRQLGTPTFPKGVKTHRYRSVFESFTVVHASGTLSAAVRSSRSATECTLLDSCGTDESLTASLRPRPVVASLEAYGPAKRPYIDFLAALGRSSHGNPHGIDVYGVIAWDRAGVLSAADRQTTTCRSVAPAGGGYVSLTADRASLRAQYSAQGPLRTRCPGPIFSTASALAGGGISRRVLAHRVFTLRLRSGGPFGDDGYSVSPSTRLSFTLRRQGGLHQQVTVEAF